MRWSTGGDLPTDYTYTGQREDLGGLMDYRARYYDVYTNRFIQADTIVPEPGSSQAYNRYMFVEGNPLKYYDPTGHYADCPGSAYGGDCDTYPIQLEFEITDEYWYFDQSGIYHWAVTFQLAENAPETIYLIQKITMQSLYQDPDTQMSPQEIINEAYNANPRLADEYEVIYYELWEFAEGDRTPIDENTGKITFDGITYQYSDMYSLPANFTEAGSRAIYGEIQLFTAGTLSSFTSERYSHAGALRMSETPPPRWDTYESTTHNFGICWTGDSVWGNAQAGETRYLFE